MFDTASHGGRGVRHGKDLPATRGWFSIEVARFNYQAILIQRRSNTVCLGWRGSSNDAVLEAGMGEIGFPMIHSSKMSRTSTSGSAINGDPPGPSIYTGGIESSGTVLAVVATGGVQLACVASMIGDSLIHSAIFVDECGDCSKVDFLLKMSSKLPI